MINGMRAVHPGEVLQEDYLKPLGLSVNALAKALDVPTSRMNDIVHERRAVSGALLWFRRTRLVEFADGV